MLKQSVKDKLERLKLKGFLRTAEASLDQMLAQGKSFEDFLDFCLDAELNDRTNRRIERLFSIAKFRYPTARLEHIDYAPERKIKKADISRYANCEWISDCRGLIISGATGVGKSWLACALGAEACHLSYSAMYFNAISLFDEISSAITLGEIKDFKKRYVLRNYLLLMILD
ncbi:ATP-binding protein [Acinetobacter baumannii]